MHGKNSAMFCKLNIALDFYFIFISLLAAARIKGFPDNQLVKVKENFTKGKKKNLFNLKVQTSVQLWLFIESNFDWVI